MILMSGLISTNNRLFTVNSLLLFGVKECDGPPLVVCSDDIIEALELFFWKVLESRKF